MGNGSSQSIILGPPRFQTSYPIRCQKEVPKYVHPQNRVLPRPVAGQKLRCTDNGSILQTAGTIRGQRESSNCREVNLDPEIMGVLRRRSEMTERGDDCYRINLRSHRMFHSDPDIAKRLSPDGCRTSDSYGNIRISRAGASARTSKLKCKKKQKAPEPPRSDICLPRHVDRTRNEEERRKNLPCRCVGKSKAPQPPVAIVHPPSPPPLPPAITTRMKINSPSYSKVMKSSAMTRTVECQESKPNYERNMHPLEKWRNCRSTGDIRIDEEESPSASRTTIFDSKKICESRSKLPSYLPQNPDPFQKEIQAVTKKIAESRRGGNAGQMLLANDTGRVSHRGSSPPKFYFSDTGVFKKDIEVDKIDRSRDTKCSTKSNFFPKVSADTSEQNCTTVDEVVPSLRRFSPARQQYKSPSRVTTPTREQKAQAGWDELSKNIYDRHDGNSDIDVRLRPVLPRKPPEMPKFSPSEVWQALGSDGLSSNQSTSDDGRLECIKPYKRKKFPTSAKVQRMSEMPLGLCENKAFKHRSMSDSLWTPRQDLLDDSDDSSDGSDDAVVPRMHTSSCDIPTKFSLPTVMFSNMRPIGSELKANGLSYYCDNQKLKHAKKSSKPLDSDYGMAMNFRKLLSKKNRYLSEENVATSNSNWTFGQYRLQKYGKQYSSELMLSDKKKNELLMESNLSDFLGDILISKANRMRNQMKSSDSGNSNFSFYSTEGQIMYLPEKGGFVQNSERTPPNSRVYDIKRKYNPSFETQKHNYWTRNRKKKTNPGELELGRKRDLELAKMLEDEVRKRRNKEKISIRQQLQKMKNLNSDEDDFDDEAYFTEPKSREESQSPFYQANTSVHFDGSDLGHKPFRLMKTSDSSHLSHWQSSPALLEDSLARNTTQPTPKGHFSSSSVLSSPDPEIWINQPTAVSSWLQHQRNPTPGRKHLGSAPIVEQCANENSRRIVGNDENVSSSPTLTPQKKKERRKTNIYKQLMDIVKKEEKQLRNAQKNDSRESSYSHPESSLSESSSSAYSYSDSSCSKSHGRKGVVITNEEYHPLRHSAAFQVAFVQPYTPSKSYRPVPFEIYPTAVTKFQESTKLKSEAS